MFIGHFGLGFAAKRAAPAASLGLLILACQFADLLWPTLLIVGLEQVAIDPGNTAVTPLAFLSYPYSHSLEMLIIWGAVVGGVYFFARRSRVSAAIIVAALVVSHWVLDWITHRPDMPLTVGGTTRLGLGLWNSLPGTIAVEAVIFAAGVWMYARDTRARDRVGSFGWWGFVATLALFYIANMIGPPPPSVPVLAWTAQGMWLLVLWGFWADRHREFIGDAPRARVTARV